MIHDDEGRRLLLQSGRFGIYADVAGRWVRRFLEGIGPKRPHREQAFPAQVLGLPSPPDISYNASKKHDDRRT
jgi:hypothetical protein